MEMPEMVDSRCEQRPADPESGSHENSQRHERDDWIAFGQSRFMEHQTAIGDHNRRRDTHEQGWADN